MKMTEANVVKLKRLGFSPEDKNDLSDCWWSLSCGWGFRPFAIRGFCHLRQRIKLSTIEYDEKWSAQMKRVYNKLGAN